MNLNALHPSQKYNNAEELEEGGGGWGKSWTSYSSIYLKFLEERRNFHGATIFFNVNDEHYRNIFAHARTLRLRDMFNKYKEAYAGRQIIVLNKIQ